MTAEATARRVLAWAADTAGPVPEGALWKAAELAAPSADTRGLAAALARTTGAKLGAGTPPFGDPAPVGLGAALLAAAIGGRRQPERARQLALALPPSRPSRARPGESRWYDLIARHGVVSAVFTDPAPPADGGSDEPLRETLLRMSPLTAVLRRPPLSRLKAGTTAEETEAAAALADRPLGAAVLTSALARWLPDADALEWRTELLHRLGTQGGPGLALDTYTTARLRHGPAWDERLRWARRVLSASGPADSLAIATIRFWAPLARLRIHGLSLADERPLLTGYRPALQLVSHYRLLTPGAG